MLGQHGYEGAASTDHDQRAQAVSLFVTDMLAGSIGQGNGVTATALKRRCNGVTALLFVREVLPYRRRSRPRSRRDADQHQRPFLTAASSLSPSRKTRFSSQAVDLAENFPPRPGSNTMLRSSV